MRGQDITDCFRAYGWAIIVIVAVGAIFWKSGLFGATAQGASGFAVLVPTGWNFTKAPGSSVIYLSNAAGAEISATVSLLAGSDCLEDAGGAAQAPLYLRLNESVLGAGRSAAANLTCAMKCSSREYAVSVRLLVRVAYADGSGAVKTEDGVIYGRCS